MLDKEPWSLGKLWTREPYTWVHATHCQVQTTPRTKILLFHIHTVLRQIPERYGLCMPMLHWDLLYSYVRSRSIVPCSVRCLPPQSMQCNAIVSVPRMSAPYACFGRSGSCMHAWMPDACSWGRRNKTSFITHTHTAVLELAARTDRSTPIDPRTCCIAYAGLGLVTKFSSQILLCKKKILITSKCRHMYGVLNVDEIKN
jgi:hypothetical protein